MLTCFKKEIIMTDQSRTLYPYFILMLLLFSCGPGQDPEPVRSVSKIQIEDNGNSGNGSDIEINFREPSSTDDIKEYRVLVMKAGAAETYTE